MVISPLIGSRFRKTDLKKQPVWVWNIESNTTSSFHLGETTHYLIQSKVCLRRCMTAIYRLNFLRWTPDDDLQKEETVWVVLKHRLVLVNVILGVPEVDFTETNEIRAVCFPLQQLLTTLLMS